MPDDNKNKGQEGTDDKNKQDAKPNEGGPVPAFDPKEFQETISKTVGEAVSQHMATYQKDQDYDPNIGRDNQDQGPQAEENPLKAVVDPLVRPELQRAHLSAEAARDTATFYATHPEALKYKDDIEKGFNQLLKQGTPFTHEAIWHWYRGKPENFEKFVDAELENRKKLEEAKTEGTVQGAGHRPGGNAQVKDAFEASDDELDKHMKDATF